MIGALLCAGALAAQAGTLTRTEISKWFPDPFLVGEKEKDVPVWPIFRQSGPPRHSIDLAGYVFESADLAPIPGFSGTPVNLLVALDTKGEFIDVAVLSHHEPVFLGGIGEEPLTRFVTQYKGLGLGENITVASANAKSRQPGATNVYLDGISKATASLRIINQSILASALKVARAKLGFSGGQDPDRIGHVRTDLYQPLTWDELVRDGLVQQLSLRNRDVEKAYDGSEAAGLDPQAVANPEEAFCNLWAAMVTVPMAGRNLLTEAAWRALNGRIVSGDHVLLVMSKGRCRFVSESFQRNSVPDGLYLKQSGLPIEMRDLDLESPLRASGQPDMDLAMAFRVISQTGLDPAQPMQLSIRVMRSRGIVYPERFARDFTLDYAIPSEFVVPAAEDQKTWVAIWKARWVDIAVLLASLAALAWVLLRQSSVVSRTRQLRWFRPAFLLFTLFFIGWYAQGQLSIVNVAALLQAAIAGQSWTFFLYDPITALIFAFVLVTLFVWGRGTYCGWLCPFGALQELAAMFAGLARVPPRRLRPGDDRRLKWIKYGLLATILAAAIFSARYSDPLMEVEPFKTAITMRFERSWPFVAYAVATVLASTVVYKPFCRYLCPLGAFLALAGRLRRWDWLERRAECGTPCQTCRNRCKYQAIDRSGKIDYAECFQCMDCAAIYNDDTQCPALILERKGKRRETTPGIRPHVRIVAVATGPGATLGANAER